jgi:hypothetical protein
VKTLAISIALVSISPASVALEGCSRKSTTMKETTETSNEMPIACRPAALTADERERSRILRNEIAAAASKTVELPNGYSFLLRGDPQVFRSAAEWITLERRCCPFLSFEIVWAQGDATAPRLSLTGPAGTKGFLAAEMPELPSRP